MEKIIKRFPLLMLATALGIFLAAGMANAFYPAPWVPGQPGCEGATTVFEFGDTVTESCTVMEDMSRSDTGTTSHGLIIGAPGITIDGDSDGDGCGDFMIDGVDPGACGPPKRAGILNDDYDDVTIKNLEIKNFCNGIHLDGTGAGAPDGNIIECCRIHDNGNINVSELGGILLGSVDSTIVTKCEIYNNIGVSSALPPGGFGIYHYVGEYCEFTQNYIHDNMAAGIFIRGMPYGDTIKYNAVEDCGCIGIAMMCMNTGGTECEYNYCNHNGGCGMIVNGSMIHPLDNTVRYNVVENTYLTDLSHCPMAQGVNCSLGWGIVLGSNAGLTTDVSFNTSCNNAHEDIANPNLKTFNYACNTCDTDAIYCEYACGEEPDANFFAVQKFPESGDLTVKFTDLSTPGSDPEASLDSWYWDFGDCSDPVTVQHPYHTYAAPGTYMVCLSVTDNEECGGGEGRRDTMCQKIAVVEETAGHFILNYSAYPFETREQDNYSGAAVMRMLIDHYRNNPWVPTQEYLQNTGIDHNQSCNSAINYVDPQGMEWTLNDELHDSTHGKYANYGIGSYDADDLAGALHYICYWQYAGPGSVPTAPTGQEYSDYSQWMAIRGIHTSEDPTLGQGEYDLFGFWINDPNPIGGIGENTYKTDTEWLTHYKPLGNLETDDVYEGKYVAVCEPPGQPDAEVNLTPAPARFDSPITPIKKEKPKADTKIPVLIDELNKDDTLKVVKAAIDGVTDELIPYDPQFADIFAETVAGEPLPVNDEKGNYYIVPFNLPMKKIEPIKNKENTLVVVLVASQDGSFKETSWVDNPVKYLPVSMEEALKLVLAKIGPTKDKPMVELVNIDSSPYYPAWKITIDGVIYIVSQDGTVTYKPVKPIKDPIPIY